MRVFLLFAVLVGVTSACQSKSGQTAGQEQDAMDDSLAVAPTEDEKTIFGVVEDASMNNFMLVTSKGDTVFVSTMDQEPSEVGGFELGDTVQVNYIEEEEEPGSNTIPVDTMDIKRLTADSLVLDNQGMEIRYAKQK